MHTHTHTCVQAGSTPDSHGWHKHAAARSCCRPVIYSSYPHTIGTRCIHIYTYTAIYSSYPHTIGTRCSGRRSQPPSCVHTYTRELYMHTHMHTHMHACTHACMHMHACTPACTHAYTHTCIGAHGGGPSRQAVCLYQLVVLDAARPDQLPARTALTDARGRVRTCPHVYTCMHMRACTQVRTAARDDHCRLAHTHAYTCVHAHTCIHMRACTQVRTAARDDHCRLVRRPACTRPAVSEGDAPANRGARLSQR